MQIGTGCVPVGGTSGWNMCTRLCNSFSDQTNAIPHWLWNQPSAPPVHPEDGVKGCLGNAMKVSEPQKMSSCHSQINLARLYSLKAESRIPKPNRSWNHGLMIFKFVYYITRKHPCKSVQAVYQWVEHVYKIVQLSDQTNAIPHWLWNQPSAPPVHPEDGVKGCLGNAMKVSEPQKMSSCHSQINLARLYPLKAKSIMLNSSRSWNHGLMIYIISPENNHANRYRLCTSGWNMCTRLCNSFSDQTNAIPHWLWNQPSAPPVHPEDGVKGCLGNAMKVSEPQKMSSCHSQINLARLYPLKAKSRIPKPNRSWNHGLMIYILYHQKTTMQIGTGCVPVGGTCVQDCATHSVIRLMRYLTGCGISPLHHRFTPKMESKGVSEML